MTDFDHEHQRAATSAFSAGIVLYQTWPNIQDDTTIRQLVMLLGKLCDSLVGGNPPAATKYLGMLRDKYTAYKGSAS